jgi:hypothetical protein
MQEGTIVRVFVASPSDAIPLSDIAKGAVDDWNATYAYDHRIMLEVVRGSTHAKLALGAHPQDTISKFLIHKCDFLFGIFRHRIGSPTETSASGTIQEIEDFCQSHPPSRVKMFFSNEDIPQDEHEQFLELKTFKEFTKKKGLYCDFRDGEDLRGKLTKQLGIEMSEIIKNLKSSATHGFHHDAEWYNQSYNTTIRHINGREWVEVDSSGAIRVGPPTVPRHT